MEKIVQPSLNLWLLIISILLIGCGIYVLLNPITALIASALFIGITFILMGVGYLIVFRRTKSYMQLSIGLLDIVIGLIFLANLGITAVSMPLIFGLWCLFIGVTQIAAGLELKQVLDRSWSWIVTSGIVGLIFALLIFFYPFIGTVTITLLMGGYLIVYGAFELNRYLRGF